MKGSHIIAQKLIKEQPSLQQAALIAGDRHLAACDINSVKEKFWREVEEAIIYFIYHGELPK